MFRRVSSAFVLICIAAGAADAAERKALDSISAQELGEHVDVLADDSFEGREAGSRGGQASSIYLMKEMKRLQLRGAGDQGSYLQSFDRNYRNILGMLEGSDPELKEQVVVISAHYDHVGYGTRRNSYGPWGYIHNGADDNASGVAGLLELIEAFVDSGVRPGRSILFAFWDGEEKGLLGSKHWVSRPTVPLDRVKLMINVDMIGRLVDNRLMIYGSRSGEGLRRLVSVCNESSGLDLDFTWELKSNSDHYTFYSKNIPVLMFHTGLHGDYHRPSDDAHKINRDGLEAVTRLMFEVLDAVAQESTSIAFRPASRQETPAKQQAFEVKLAQPPPRLGLSWRKEPSDLPLVVARTNPGSAAYKAGIVSGDKILQFDVQEVLGPGHFRKLVLAATIPADMTIEREGMDEPMKLTVHLPGNPVRLGLSWREDPAEPGTLLVTRVIRGSAADEAELTAGDRVYQIGNREFADGLEFIELSQTLPSPIELLIERNGTLRHVKLNVLPRAKVGLTN